ncbi:hypothetical protein [Sporobacter termitidis]|uniref:hypothetical protein n=1 Tax=Sporobacter termitidis TaxID=44749 RepID=UPI0011607F0C|nr:hypothetical protein [Sporobacter termitidis]
MKIMTLDEWKNNKDFDEISREMNGLFNNRQLTATDVITGGGAFLNPTVMEAAQVKPQPPAQ